MHRRQSKRNGKGAVETLTTKKAKRTQVRVGKTSSGDGGDDFVLWLLSQRGKVPHDVDLDF